MGEWRVLPREGRDRLGEGITWVPGEQALYWVDILGRQVHRYDLGQARHTQWAMPDRIGWLIPRTGPDGAPGHAGTSRFIAGMASGLHALTLDPAASGAQPGGQALDPAALTPLPSPVPGPGNRMNDACADSHGRIWAGTMSMDGSRDTGALYRIDPDLGWQQVDAPYRIANGPALSPDGAWLYHADSARGLVYRLPLHDDGTLGQREPFIEFPARWGAPDGMTVDAAGGLWIAHWGGGCVSRFTPTGLRDGWIDLPASQITRPCFAGPALDRLFVTSAADGLDSTSPEPLAGAVFELDLSRFAGLRGLPPHGFPG